MAKRLGNIVLICVITIVFLGCGAGTNSMLQNTTPTGYLKFSESSMTLKIGESAEVIASLHTANGNIPKYLLNIISSESGIVLLAPNTCLFNANYDPSSCNFLVTGVAAGSTQIIIDYLAIPQQPLVVTVIP